MTITTFLADDHGVVRDGLCSYLKAEPDVAVVGHAANGRDALDQIVALLPNVSILDIEMPILDGFQTTRQLVQRQIETRIIILSMYASTEYVFRALDAGAVGFVAKDCAARELVEAVRAVHQGHRYLSQQIANGVIEDYVERRRDTGTPTPLADLSRREQQILIQTVEGNSTDQIAEALSLSPTTINTYRSRMMRKLEIDDLPSLVKFAIRHGLTDL